MEPREALAKAPLSSNLKRDVLDALAYSAKVCRFAPGEFLDKEGETAVAFYCAVRG